jgi:hypothetical protein
MVVPPIVIVSVAPGISPSIRTESMHVHNPEAKIGDGSGLGTGTTGTGTTEGLLVPATLIVGSVPVYCWRAVIGWPVESVFVNGTQILPGLVDVAVPTKSVLAGSL